MKKIPSLFQRNYDSDRLVRDEVVPGCEWVLDGEGMPTVKFDGTSCLVANGALWKRYDAKKGKEPPAYFLPAQREADAETGHLPGWVPVGDGPEDRWHREAFSTVVPLRDGTYELVGPKVQGNPYGRDNHVLLRHGELPCIALSSPPTYAALKVYLAALDIEGIVWHHSDGRMCKIKRRDFGLPWPVKQQLADAADAGKET